MNTTRRHRTLLAHQTERETFAALQSERYPAKYAAWIRKYWRNLAEKK